MSAETELLLMNASRAELVRQRILPALQSGQIVLCDRFYDSTVAYQGFGRGLDRTAVQSVIQLAVGGLRPDRTLWLDVAPEIARTRLAGRKAAQATSEPSDRFDDEQEAFFTRVAQSFREAYHAEPDRWRHVDAGGSLECVEEAVWSAVSNLFQETASVG